MRRPSTLRSRLALVAVCTTAAWAGLLTAGFNLVLTSQLHAEAESTLRTKAAVVASTIVLHPDGGVSVREPADDEKLDANTWIYADGKAIQRPRAGAQLQAAADRMATGPARFAQTGEPTATRLYAYPVVTHGRRVATVVTGAPLDPYRNVARITLFASVGLALLLLAGVYAATRLLIARALSPVQAMTAQAAVWGAEDVRHRFGEADRPGELAALATSLDGLLDRLAALLRHEQQMTEELSHELRTPLSLITAEGDLLRTRGRTAAERDQAHDRIAAAAAQMSRILETLLTTARSRTASSTGRCELAPVLRLAAERATTPDGVTLEVAPGPAGLAAGVDADVLERIVAPLLENALRYARRSVQLTPATGNGAVVVRVRDDGPGVPPDLAPHVFDPGRRGDDGHAGAGLGLSLARRLARAAGGDLVLVDGVFEIRLPRA